MTPSDIHRRCMTHASILRMSGHHRPPFSAHRSVCCLVQEQALPKSLIVLRRTHTAHTVEDHLLRVFPHHPHTRLPTIADAGCLGWQLFSTSVFSQKVPCAWHKSHICHAIFVFTAKQGLCTFPLHFVPCNLRTMLLVCN